MLHAQCADYSVRPCPAVFVFAYKDIQKFAEPEHGPSGQPACEDPLSKNFKCPKVVSVPDRTTTWDQETEKRCKLLESAFASVVDTVPPTYSDQGMPRGRKPKPKSKSVEETVNKKPKGKVSKRSKKGKSKAGCKRKLKVKKVKKALCAERVQSQPSMASAPPVEAMPKPKALKAKAKALKPKAKAKAKAKTAPPKPMEITDDFAKRYDPEELRKYLHTWSTADPAEHPALKDEWVKKFGTLPDDLIDAPIHATRNGVYSTAYRRFKSAKQATEVAKFAGQEASAILYVFGKISPSLSGIPRPPRTKKVETEEGGEEPEQEA